LSYFCANRRKDAHTYAWWLSVGWQSGNTARQHGPWTTAIDDRNWLQLVQLIMSIVSNSL
jgi:hypothetical protein